MRIKRMPKEEFGEVIKRDWIPVQLTGGAIPAWLQGLPSPILNAVYASGSSYSSGMLASGGVVPAGELVGGIDVYRNAYDDPVELNKDWYAIIRENGSDAVFLVAGPIKDYEHWLNEIPDRLKNAEILSVPPKPQAPKGNT